MGIRNLNRWQAFAGHLSFSLLLGAAVFALFRFVWYPYALFTLAGAGKLLLLLVGIDVVLGPSLTLIVFNPRKKSLFWDLAVVIAIQMGGLGYGVWVVAQSRPVFLVAVVDRLEVVSANELGQPLNPAVPTKYRALSWVGPVIVGAARPPDPQRRIEIALSASSGGRDVDRLPEYYVPFESISAGFFRRASTSVSAVPELAGKLTPDTGQEIVPVPIHARFGWGTALMRKTDGKLLNVIHYDQLEDRM